MQLFLNEGLALTVRSTKSAAATRKPAGASDAKRRGDPASTNFALANSPLYRIVRTAGRYTIDMENALKSSGMDLMSWRALMILDEASSCSVSAIAERSVTRLSTMTRVVQRLEKKRYVRLSRGTSDARVTEVQMTALGKQVLEGVRNVASRIYNVALDGFSAAEIVALKSMMQRIFSNLSACSTEG